MVDEAQDISTTHGDLLSLLQKAGSCISVIGDPNQAIFEFADADGSFLRTFAKAHTAILQPLNENRRSVEAIVAVANALSGENSKATRENPKRFHGAYFIRYGKNDERLAVATFTSILSAYSYVPNEAIILCRGTALVDSLLALGNSTGTGATERFAYAAICRDRQGDIAEAFEFALDGVLKLLHQPPHILRHNVLTGSPDTVARAVRRALWRFLKNPTNGLPLASLSARCAWQPMLKERISGFLQIIEDTCPLKRLDTWPKNLTTKDLKDEPLLQIDHSGKSQSGIPIRTVHQAKGEGINAVLYIAKKDHIKNLLGGPSTEDGRVGYVAITRARDLLLLAVPISTDIGALERVGFRKWA